MLQGCNGAVPIGYASTACGLVPYQGHQGGETEPGLSVTRRKMTLLSREPTPKEAQRGFVGPVGHVHSQRRKNRATERGVTDGPLEGASGGCSGANALAWECNIQLGHQPPAALTPLRMSI
jgi:hypothetical protein